MCQLFPNEYAAGVSTEAARNDIGDNVKQNVYKGCYQPSVARHCTTNAIDVLCRHVQEQENLVAALKAPTTSQVEC